MEETKFMYPNKIFHSNAIELVSFQPHRSLCALKSVLDGITIDASFLNPPDPPHHYLDYVENTKSTLM